MPTWSEAERWHICTPERNFNLIAGDRSFIAWNCAESDIAAVPESGTEWSGGQSLNLPMLICEGMFSISDILKLIYICRCKIDMRLLKIYCSADQKLKVL